MISKFDQYLDNISKWGVITCIALMLSLSIVNIVLRQLGTTFIWIEPFVRHLVFLATFFGGALATGSSEHIKIDIVSRVLEKSKHTFLKNWIERLVLLVTLIEVRILLSSSIDLIH